MATINFKGSPVKTLGELPSKGSQAPSFTLTKSDLSNATLADFAGKKVILNIFPSIDTGICAASVREFNQKVNDSDNAVVLCISKDLPFAHSRFCEAEGLKSVVPLSQYKDSSFSDAYRIDMADGPLEGLMSRAVVVIDEDGKVIYTEQVPEIAQEPDYEAAIAALS